MFSLLNNFVSHVYVCFSKKEKKEKRNKNEKSSTNNFFLHIYSLQKTRAIAALFLAAFTKNAAIADL